MRITRSGHARSGARRHAVWRRGMFELALRAVNTAAVAAAAVAAAAAVDRTDGHDARRRRHRHVRPSGSRADRAPRRRPRRRRAARRRHRVSRKERPRTFATASIRSWGQFRSRWHPVPGNHEYESAGAAPYFAYFGEAAGPPGLGYYSFTAGDWLILMLNSNIAATRGSPQWEFVRAELERQRTPCTMAVWHHPLFTSGPNGNNTFMRDMWALLEASRVEVILNGHDHLYERFARQTADGTRRSGQRHPPVHRRAPAAPSSTTSCGPRRIPKSAS